MYTFVPSVGTSMTPLGDPDNGGAPGTAFDDIPDDWTCPICGVGKDMFNPA